jgi:acetyl esterase/lipase
MKKSLTTLMLIVGGVVLWIGSESINSAQEASRSIDQRTVPVPAAASQELQDAISAAPVLNVGGADVASLETDADWEKFVAAADGPAGQALEFAAKQLGVSVESHEVEGVPIFRVVPDEVDPRHAEHRFLYVHGGAYVLGGGAAGAQEALMIASRTKMPVFSIDYRMPPRHPFPAAIEDVVAVYRHVLGNRPAKSIALGGTSAGGGLTLAAVQRFLELGLDVPGAIYAGTPWADLTKTSDSLFTNEDLDRVLVTYEGLLRGAAELYANGQDLKNPLISPLYGDFRGFPPAYLVTGTRDMLLSDTARTHRKLRTAGAVADLNVYEGLSHAGYLVVPNSPESQQVYGELNAFLLQHLD